MVCLDAAAQHLDTYSAGQVDASFFLLAETNVWWILV